MKRKSKKKIIKTIPSKKGRPRVCLELYEARELIRKEKLGSVSQYKRWWLLNLPARIPKRPDRAYKHEWLGWNDFLGSDNVFSPHRRRMRSFIDARTFAHQLGFRIKQDWLDYATSGKKPIDIPSRPDVVYRTEWYTWKDFLGADIPIAKRNIELAKAIFFIIHNQGRPNNVFQLGITMEGKETILQYQVKQKFRIVGLYYSEIEFDWESIIQKYGKRFWESDRNDEYLIPNVNEFIFSIGEFVEQVPRQ
jgi:hypothetical protein